MQASEDNKPTLSQVLAVLANSEDALEQFDPEVVVGNVEDKVDAIHHVLEKMKATTAHLKDMAKPLTEKARAIDNARERLREYVVFSMKKAQFENLPGKAYKASLRSGHHKVLIESEREPTPQDATKHKAFVKTVVSFEWDHEAIEAAHAKGEELPPGLTAKNVHSEWVVFTANVPSDIEPKKKARAKRLTKDDIEFEKMKLENQGC